MNRPTIEDRPSPAAGLGYQPALDGLRAVAVLGVMAFHADLPAATGGFLGVDVFFVLSGFLITTLLCREAEATGTIALGRFYMRRALRLLPALVVLCAALQLFSLSFVFPHAVAQLQRETLATLLYVANWAQVAGIIHPQGGFGHAWSLAIEEQFYLVWPLVLLFLLRRLPRAAVLAAVAAAAAASAFLRSLLWQGPESFSRVFHGSDTRAETLLVGCLLALVLEWGYLGTPAARRRVAGILGGAAAVVLALLFTMAPHDSPRMLGSGLTVAALATGFVLLHLQTTPRGRFARALSWPPLVATGRISYGLYLWHWPLFLYFREETFALSPASILAARFAATFAAAIASWFLVERLFLRRKRDWASPPGRNGESRAPGAPRIVRR